MSNRLKPTEDELNETEDPILLLNDIRKTLNGVFGMLFLLLCLTILALLRFWSRG